MSQRRQARKSKRSLSTHWLELLVALVIFSLFTADKETLLLGAPGRAGAGPSTATNASTLLGQEELPPRATALVGHTAPPSPVVLASVPPQSAPPRPQPTSFAAAAAAAAAAAPAALAQVPKMEADQFCKLDACMRHDPRSPRLFVQEYTDGSGHRMTNIIQGIAAAARNGMNFGGVVAIVPQGRIDQGSPHGHEFRKVIDAFFGQDNAWIQLLFQKPPPFDEEVTNVRGLEEQRPSFKELANVYSKDANELHYNESRPKREYFTPYLQAVLRQPLTHRRLLFAPGRPTVAIHARRGDLKKGEWMVLPNLYYLKLVGLIRERWPEADVHLWSSTKVWKKDKKGKYWKSKDFDDFRKQDVSVHLDDDNLVDVWAHLALADVFVMAPSYFSYVPAVLSPFCVIYPGGSVNNHGRALEGWMDGTDDGRKSFRRELDACLAIAAKHVATDFASSRVWLRRQVLYGEEVQ